MRYRYDDDELKQILKSIVVVVDTREKENSHITTYFDNKGITYIKKALSNGDYNFYIPQNVELGLYRNIWFDKDIMIERKASLDELALNLTKERARFEEELSTSKALWKYLIIENAEYKDILNGNYRSDYNSKSFLGSLHSFHFKYDLQIIFMPDKSLTPVWTYATMQYYARNIIK